MIQPRLRPDGARMFRSATPRHAEQPANRKEQGDHGTSREGEEGAMSRRLAGMAEETMDTGSKSDRKLMSEVGFSDELKKQLEERIAQTAFEARHQQALSEASMPTAAGKGTREQAAAQPWTGSETLHDAALRMLDDGHKKLRLPSRAPQLPVKNLRPSPKKNISAADRLAKARDKTSRYALSQHADMTEQEKEQMRKDLKERFTPGARPMPTTLQGLTSLANERIEDAIARGQFKNIPRGKGMNVERDYNANSPFLDTTEYFMNKIIQKQEIVPPWIEKQQELVKNVSSFRNRLRNDWRRHAARSISSKGGTIDAQVRMARGYALAEDRVNPRPGVKFETLTGIDATGHLTSITVEEQIAVGIPPEPVAASSDGIKDVAEAEVIIKVTETSLEDAPRLESELQTAPLPSSTESATSPAPSSPLSATPSPPPPPPPPPPPTIQPVSAPILPMSHPYRDPAWERIEHAYHTLAVAELNSLTRSYNLMAPKIAQKPYYTLQRELNRCFAEVAPTLADEILERSRRPNVKISVVGHREGGVMERFQGDGHVARVRDEGTEKGYGFRQFWRDLFRKEGDDGSTRQSVRRERSRDVV